RIPVYCTVNAHQRDAARFLYDSYAGINSGIHIWKTVFRIHLAIGAGDEHRILKTVNRWLRIQIDLKKGRSAEEDCLRYTKTVERFHGTVGLRVQIIKWFQEGCWKFRP